MLRYSLVAAGEQRDFPPAAWSRDQEVGRTEEQSGV